MLREWLPRAGAELANHNKTIWSLQLTVIMKTLYMYQVYLHVPVQLVRLGLTSSDGLEGSAFSFGPDGTVWLQVWGSFGASFLVRFGSQQWHEGDLLISGDSLLTGTVPEKLRGRCISHFWLADDTRAVKTVCLVKTRRTSWVVAKHHIYNYSCCH